MTDGWTIDALIGLGVVAACLGCVGFFKPGSALAKINQPIFLAGTTGTALLLAALFYDGLTVRVGKMLLLEALLLVSGLVVSHAVGRSARRARQAAMIPGRVRRRH